MEPHSPNSLARPRTIVVVFVTLAVVFGIWLEGADDLAHQFAMFLVAVALPLAGAGVWFAWRALAKRMHIDAASRRTLQIFPDVPIRNVLRWKPQKLAPPMKDLPSFGIFTSIPLSILIFSLMNFGAPWPSTGIVIPMTLRNPGAGPNSPRTETLGVHVAAGNRFYVNAQVVPREQLREKLSQELGKRVVWTVYVEADDNVAFGDVVFAFDTIKGLGSQVFWITPRARDEWNRQPRQP